MEGSTEPLLQLSDVGLSDPLGRHQLLENISFMVNKGDRCCIVGPSGSGKTTLLRLINRLLDPTTGSILFQSQPLSKFQVISLRQKIVLVPQEPKLLGMTVQETLVYPLTLQKLSQSEINQRLDYWRSQLSIPDDWLERNELQLSLGQRQLITIVRGLMMQPTLLLLDEPTSALDRDKALQLIEVLKTITTDTQMTILMVNHQLELVEKLTTQVLKLNRGKLQT
ncbi:ABC transporter ATP-binding protein [Crocosphaera subtropica ATCC 51142]|uniref:ABC transporter ATP-binding protein n=1 Tax=Crocosphaera subtropica (strain ATCC 51142 / BH68) TaxID=43989 RepID=B1WZX4_CROS5|nr:ATP-binding cassette domain-containing protein [Crocosphaera subtropica]ACB52873.1 ABC transporter ATP-binding protein [Crocosphaera subtropica ATCC 51142]